MSGFELTAALVDHLAWPAVVLILGFAWRRQLGSLLDGLEEFTGPGGIGFRRGWASGSRQASKSLEGATEEGAGDSSTTSTPVVDVAPIEVFRAETDPLGAIEAAYARLGYRLRELLAGGGTPAFSAQAPDVRDLLRQGLAAGAVSTTTAESIEGILVLHDLARNAPARVTASQAREFQLLASAVLYALRRRP